MAILAIRLGEGQWARRRPAGCPPSSLSELCLGVIGVLGFVADQTAEGIVVEFRSLRNSSPAGAVRRASATKPLSALRTLWVYRDGAAWGAHPRYGPAAQHAYDELLSRAAGGSIRRAVRSGDCVKGRTTTASTAVGAWPAPPDGSGTDPDDQPLATGNLPRDHVGGASEVTGLALRDRPRASAGDRQPRAQLSLSPRYADDRE
jgi:hypothetical protein